MLDTFTDRESSLIIVDGATFTSVDILEEISFEMLSMRLLVPERSAFLDNESMPRGILLLSDAADPDTGIPE